MTGEERKERRRGEDRRGGKRKEERGEKKRESSTIQPTYQYIITYTLIINNYYQHTPIQAGSKNCHHGGR